MEEANDKVLMTLRHSRKAFLVEYTCGFFLLALLLIGLIKQIDLPESITYLLSGLGFIGLAGTELRRYFGDRYKIMPTKLSVTKGVLKIRKKNVYYQPLGFIPDLNIRQGALQRLLGFGTVHLQVGNSNLELKDIDNPHQILEMLENLIEETRKANLVRQTMRQ
ncbi:PH domain-containing protein [Candidatus Woesearchaeota archaeon]|nr:PH domain-containing protein [Candidatus Woesearchaeota archaeon]MBI2582160.1 PH domain-containing protein [Candidatus Woesearchaeota archaeon]